MKKIFTLLVSAIVTLSAFADSRFGEINITRLDNRKYQVEIDGRRFAAMDQTLTIRDLTPGVHNVKIYTVKKGNPIFGALGGFGKSNLIYNQNLAVKPYRQVNITIKKSKVSVEEKRIRRKRNSEPNDRWNDREDDYGYGNDRNDREDDYGYGNDRNDRNDRFYRPITESSFLSLKETLHRENFENDRLAMAKQTIEQHYFTTEQMKQLVRLFAFENNKLAVAKIGFDQTVDKNNYMQLCNEFAYSRSKEELTEFIRNR